MTVEIQREAKKVRGPVDYLVVLFPGNKFTGTIAPEMRKLEDSGIVRVLDLLFIRKNENGDVESFEISDLGDEAERAYQAFKSKVVGWLSQDDVEAIGNDIPNNSAAAVLLFENLWAIGVREAMVNAGGKLLVQGRIPPEIIEQAMNAPSTMQSKED